MCGCRLRMVIMTFGSGFQIENDSVSYLQRMKALNNYAADKGIAIGGYSLLASRGAKPKDAAISHHTGYPAKTREEGSRFGLSPCIASDWGSDYFKRLKNFFHTTGMNVFENDGSIPAIPVPLLSTVGTKDIWIRSGNSGIGSARSISGAGQKVSI